MIFRWLVFLAALLYLSPASIQPASAKSPAFGQFTLTLEADLAGQYISKLTATPNTTQISGPGQEITLNLKAGGLTDAKQVELFIAVRPPQAFNLDASVFTPAAPYLTIGTGVELVENQVLRLGSVSLQNGNFGDADLGTLALTLDQDYVPGTIVSVHILFLSIGPASDVREIYDEKISCLEWFLEPLNTAVLANPWGQIKSTFRQDFTR